MQHTSRVSCQLAHLYHCGIFPHYELILTEAVRRNELFLVIAPLQGAHLGFGVHGVEARARVCIPKANGAVGRATAAR